MTPTRRRGLHFHLIALCAASSCTQSPTTALDGGRQQVPCVYVTETLSHLFGDADRLIDEAELLKLMLEEGLIAPAVGRATYVFGLGLEAVKEAFQSSGSEVDVVLVRAHESVYIDEFADFIDVRPCWPQSPSEAKVKVDVEVYWRHPKVTHRITYGAEWSHLGWTLNSDLASHPARESAPK